MLHHCPVCISNISNNKTAITIVPPYLGLTFRREITPGLDSHSRAPRLWASCDLALLCQPGLSPRPSAGRLGRFPARVQPSWAWPFQAQAGSVQNQAGRSSHTSLLPCWVPGSTHWQYPVLSVPTVRGWAGLRWPHSSSSGSLTPISMETWRYKTFTTL